MIKGFNIFSFIIKEVKVKRNIILVLVSIVIFIGLFLSLTLINNNNEKIDFYSTRYVPNVRFEVYYKDRNSKELNEIKEYLNASNADDPNYDSYRFKLYSLLYPSTETDEEKKLYEKVKNIEHVVEVSPRKYNRELRMEINDGLSESDILHKTLFVKPLQYEEDIKLITGNYPNKNEIVCPQKVFFTRNLEYYSDILDKKREYNIKIGEKFEVYRDKFNLDNNNTSNLKVVGIYNNNYTFDKLNTCYTSFETIDDFNSSEGYEELIIGDTKYIFPLELLGISVRVDNVDNVSEVQKKIQELGLEIFEYDKVTFVASSINTPYYIAITAIVLLIIILVLFIRKKCIYKKYNYALMEVQGYTNINIIIIEVIENIITICISYIISMLFFCIIFKFAPYRIMYYYEVYGNPLSIPIKLMLLMFPIVQLLVILVTIIVCKKYLKKSIITNLEVI